MKQAMAHSELADVFEAAAHRAMRKHGLVVPVPQPVTQRRFSDDGKPYDRAPLATIDAIYADMGLPVLNADSNDLLRDLQKKTNERLATREDKHYIRNCFEQVLLNANQMLGLVGEKVKNDEVVALCSNIADTAVANAIIFGNDAESLRFAQEFLREFRRELAQKKGFDEALAVRLKRCEDKLDIGMEAVDVIARKVQFPEGQRDFFDYALARYMQHTYGKTPQEQPPSEEDIRQAGVWSSACYAQQLKGCGLTNGPLHAVTPYSWALVERALHVAEAEFLRLPRGRSAGLSEAGRARQVREAQKTYNSQRIPVLLDEVLHAFPPVTEEAAKQQPVEELSCYLHDTDRLFGALKWLDAQRARAAANARG